jgi:hypothetical protein
VEKMMAHLRLTAVESTAVVIDDQDDADLVDPDRAFVGKVLAPNVLHIQTISAAMRPAWGNLKGLTINRAGNNLFTVELGSMADRDRIMDGSPWRVGKHAVLLKKYDAEIEPHRVMFDRLAIWPRIIALPPRLMRVERGFEIARPIGVVKKIESDDRGRCWGGFMRLHVEIAVQEPLICVVTIFSSRLQSTDSYEVQYERLPFYCFSCGLLGHSALACPSPAERDANGDLPYTAKKLSVDEIYKRAGNSRSGHTGSSTGDHSARESKGSVRGSSSNGGRGWGKPNQMGHGQQDEGEVSSPLKGGRGNGQGRGQATHGRGRGRASTGKEMFSPGLAKASTIWQKCKTGKQKEQQLMIEGPVPPNDSVIHVTGNLETSSDRVEDDVCSSDSNKKQRTSSSRSADLAEAVEQPHLTQ